MKRNYYTKKVLSYFLITGILLFVPFTVTAHSDAVAEVEFEERTYFLYDESLTWEEAKNRCVALGGHLATITSEEEQEVIEKLIQKGGRYQYWLGGTDDGTEGRWRWITDEDWEYDNWDIRQPDNGFGYEDYLQIYRKPNPRVPQSVKYTWNDITIDNVFNERELDFFNEYSIGFICEIEPRGISVNPNMTSFGSSVSSWAKEEVENASDSGLIPDKLLGADLTQKVTRAEFAAISVSLYEELSSVTYEYDMLNNPFEDISGNDYEQEILKAYSLNITTGTSETAFSPDDEITREQMATMLARTYKKAMFDGWTIAKDKEYPLDYSGVQAFADDEMISSYAKESVYFMAKWKIIQGVDNSTFAPKGNAGKDEAYGYATREQAIIIAQRTAANLGNTGK